MPKRTNAFQTVVLVIKQYLAGDAKVTESEELIDLISGEKREVDICIRSQVAGHRVLLSIECRDHKRRQAIGWVEEMQAKHSRLPTDRLVLISSSGFTRNARAKAESFNIETATPEDLTKTRVNEIIDGTRARLTKLKFQTQRVRAWVIDPETGDVEEVDTIPALTVFSGTGAPLGELIEIVEAIKPYVQPEIGRQMFDAPDDTDRFEITVTDPREIPIGNPPVHQDWYLEKIQPVSRLMRIERIEITGAVKVVRTPTVSLRDSRLQGTEFNWAETTFDGSKTVIMRIKGREDAIIMRTL